MKRSFVILLAAIAAACGGVSEETANNAEPAKPVVSVESVDQKPEGEQPRAKLIVGEKIEREQVADFEESRLPEGWELIDNDIKKQPSPFSVGDGKLSLIIRSGKDMYADNFGAPHLVKAVSGDFQIETRVIFSPKQDYQGAGLLVFSDKENYLRLERGFGGTGGGGSGVRLDVRKADEYVALTTPEQAPTDASEVDLKMVRIGQTFIAYWRLNDESEWKEIGEYKSDYPDSVKVGLIGVNTGDEITARFDHIKLQPAPK